MIEEQDPMVPAEFGSENSLWEWTEDGYCVSCGNGHWKLHAPWCVIENLRDYIRDNMSAEASTVHRTKAQG